MVKKKRQAVQPGNKYAHLSQPQAILDYHGRGILTVDEICSLAKDFIEESVRSKYRRVLIITGKGLHSSHGPIIGPVLREYLPRLPFVRSVNTGRRDRGGAGALEVELV